MILFCLDNLKVLPFLVVFGFDFLPFFAIKSLILGVKIQIYCLRDYFEKS